MHLSFCFKIVLNVKQHLVFKWVFLQILNYFYVILSYQQWDILSAIDCKQRENAPTQGKTDQKVVSLSRAAGNDRRDPLHNACATFEPFTLPCFNPAVTRIGSHLESSLFARLNPAAAELDLFYWERSHLSSRLLPDSVNSNIVYPCSVSRGNARPSPFLLRKSTQALPPGWQDGCCEVQINNMPRTIEGSHNRGNTRANVNFLPRDSWSVTWPHEPRARTMLHVRDEICNIV